MALFTQLVGDGRPDVVFLHGLFGRELFCLKYHLFQQWCVFRAGNGFEDQ